MALFHHHPSTVPGLISSRFQKRFQFRREKITRDCDCPWMPTSLRISTFRSYLSLTVSAGWMPTFFRGSCRYFLAG
jgi:hypothetical protein